MPFVESRCSNVVRDDLNARFVAALGLSKQDQNLKGLSI